MDLNKEKKNEKLEETLKDKQSFPEPRAFQVLKKKKKKRRKKDKKANEQEGRMERYSKKTGEKKLNVERNKTALHWPLSD